MSTKARGIATFILIFASFMDLIDATIVNVALPSIRADLGATAAQLEWVVSAYMLAFAVLLVTGGRLGDIYGRQRIFGLGVAGFTVFSAVAALAPNANMLVATRIGQGAFAALMAPQLLSSIQVLYRPKERAGVIGLIGAVTGMAAVIGPLLGGWLVTSNVYGLEWRSIFLINVPIGIAIIVAAVKYVPNSTSERPLRLDLAGVVLATVGLFLVMFPLVEGRDQGWTWWIWAMFAAAAVVLGVFIRNQVRRERADGSALLPMHLFGNRGYTSGLVAQFLFQGSMVGFFLVLTIYVQTGLGFSPISAGLMLLPFSLGAFVGTGVSIPLGAKLGKVVMFVGAAFQAAAVAWAVQVVHTASTGLGRWDLALPLALGGVGLGLLVVPLVDVALATVDPADAGAASGAYSTFQQVGAATGVAVVGVVFFGAVGTTSGDACGAEAACSFSPAGLEHGLTAAVWVSLIGYAACALATLLLPSRSAVQAHAERERVLQEA